MRLHRIILSILTLSALTLAPLTSPATAGALGGTCQKVYAAVDTTVVEDHVEIGQAMGTVNGAAYLRYDDTAPPTDPQWNRPNFVITTKEGNLNLWVYSATNQDEGDNWWRNFKTLRAEGTGIYAAQRIVLEIYGKCNVKGGVYEILGTICPSFVPPKK